MRNVALTDEQKEEMVKLWRDGMPMQEIADRFHIAKRTVNRYTTELYKQRHTTKEERAEMQKMYKEGYSLQDIADEFNVSVQTVYQYTSRIGIKQEQTKNFWKVKILEEWDDVCDKLKHAKKKTHTKPTCASGKTFR